MSVLHDMLAGFGDLLRALFGVTSSTSSSSSSEDADDASSSSSSEDADDASSSPDDLDLVEVTLQPDPPVDELAIAPPEGKPPPPMVSQAQQGGQAGGPGTSVSAFLKAGLVSAAGAGGYSPSLSGVSVWSPLTPAITGLNPFPEPGRLEPNPLLAPRTLYRWAVTWGGKTDLPRTADVMDRGVVLGRMLDYNWLPLSGYILWFRTTGELVGAQRVVLGGAQGGANGQWAALDLPIGKLVALFVTDGGQWVTKVYTTKAGSRIAGDVVMKPPSEAKYYYPGGDVTAVTPPQGASLGDLWAGTDFEHDGGFGSLPSQSEFDSWSSGLDDALEASAEDAAEMAAAIAWDIMEALGDQFREWVQDIVSAAGDWIRDAWGWLTSWL